ncbi:MAG: hypothetical protein IIW94_03795 [Clostridia bacterium]|nr:hypothetical protein [Clostridia bacterium]
MIPLIGEMSEGQKGLGVSRTVAPYTLKECPLHYDLCRGGAVFLLLKLVAEKREGGGKSLAKGIENELKKITSLKLSESEKADLTEKGITLKNPTKLTLLAAALFEKAAKGDLAALKEIFLRLEPENKDISGVVLIDDIKNST